METPEIKNINLLYTNWDGDVALPNGVEFGLDNVFSDFSNFISTHLNLNQFIPLTKKINIKKVNLDSYNKDETYFYGIAHPPLCLDEILDDVFPINQEVINLSIKNNNIYFCFSYEHEVDKENMWIKLLNYIQEYKLDESKFIIINNDYRIYEHKEHYNSKINVHKCGFLKYSSYRVFNELDVKFKDEKDGKFFMCRNRSAKPHRISLLINLFVDGIIDDVNYSLIPENNERINSFHSLMPYFKVSYLKNNKELIDYVNNHSKIDDYELSKNWINSETNQFQGEQPPLFLVPELLESFENSYVNIVTESIFNSERNSIHHSEKSFRPFFYYQFPIFLASPQHVAYLREKYDFDMFDDVINHSYDTEWNNGNRLNMVIDEIKRINDNKDFFKKFYINNKQRFIKNKEIHKKISIEAQQNDLNFFWNML